MKERLSSICRSRKEPWCISQAGNMSEHSVRLKRSKHSRGQNRTRSSLSITTNRCKPSNRMHLLWRKNSMHPMRTIRIEAVTLNIGTGGPGDKLEKALKLLQHIAGKKPVETKTTKRIPTWGLRPGLSVGAKVTVRGEAAHELLGRLLKAMNNTLPVRKFDLFGSFSFGIKEYLDIPGVAYDPAIGIIGLEVAVTLTRPGFRIRNRSIQNKKIPARHRIKPEETLQFLKTNFGLNIAEEE